MTAALDEAPTDLGTIRTEITVGTADLRDALKSVIVHAGRDKDEPLLQRIRIVVRLGNLLVAATNRYTLGLALVSVWDNTYDDDGVIIDLPVTQVAEILAMFRAPTNQDDDAGDDDLRIRLTDRYLTITDVAGLIPGKEVTWPRTSPEDTFPDLPKVMGGMLADAGTGRPNALHTNGKFLALFKVAATTYGRTVVLEPTKDDVGALVVSCGESFLGALMPIRPTDEQVTEQEGWRLAWHRRLSVLDPDSGELVNA